MEVFCWQLESHIHSVGYAGWNCLASSRAPARPIPQMPPPASRPALFFFPRLAHKYPRAAEQRKITISTHKGAMRLEEQVRVETLVSISRILRHQPRRYPLMAFLESGMAKDRLELVEEVSRDKLDLLKKTCKSSIHHFGKFFTQDTSDRFSSKCRQCRGVYFAGHCTWPADQSWICWRKLAKVAYAILGSFLHRPPLIASVPSLANAGVYILQSLLVPRGP